MADEDVFYDPDTEADSDLAIQEYDIVASPNDFNVSSYFSFIESGAIVVPGFQRHYVWDLRRASKLIESLLMGLPIPQIFLYEDGRNRFLVIDGQQRLMTIYYFMKGRFPKRDARSDIRAIFTTKGRLDPVDLENNDLFVPFRLNFRTVGGESPYQGLTYASLGELKPTFDLRTIRNIVVKQVRPDGDRSSIFELFNRLNTGGVNLSQQEIRMSLFYGRFLQGVAKLNELPHWRQVLGGNPDQRQKDIEVMLRMFALAAAHETFKKPLSKFINEFCGNNRREDFDATTYPSAFAHFTSYLALIDRELYLEPKSKRVSVPLLEAVFVACADDAVRTADAGRLVPFASHHLSTLRTHVDYERFFTGKTTDADALKGRIATAKAVIGSA